MHKKAFTLVELLVVIAIIAVLIGLLLPAVNAAREAARLTQCKSHLKNLSLAAISYESAFGVFPSGGWGYRWVGDPERAMGVHQPGGWGYTLLPFLEQQDLFEMGGGLKLQQKLAASARRIQTPLEMMNCPSRRPAAVYPTWCVTCSTPFGALPVEHVARSDYAANSGDARSAWLFEGPQTIAEGDLMTRARRWPHSADRLNGVIYIRSTVSTSAITDGSTKTYLFGEKYVQADAYNTGKDWADNESLYCGFNNDTHRSTHPHWIPLADEVGRSSTGSFGSAHRTGFNMAMCDGSVAMINYSIDTLLHRRRGVRNDGR